MNALDTVAVAVLTAEQCAHRYQILTRRGDPSPDAWRRLVRNGNMPEPIDDTVDSSQWRWSIAVLDRFDRLGCSEFYRRQALGTLWDAPAAVVTDPDPTPAHGNVRPDPDQVLTPLLRPVVGGGGRRGS